jgi:hypothetical protein
MNRRDFVALSAMSAASSTVFARSASKSNFQQPSRALGKLPVPSLARVVPVCNTSRAHLIQGHPPTPAQQATLSAASMTIAPLSCLQHRTENDTGFDIELLHPTIDTSSIICSASNMHSLYGTGSYPAANRVAAPQDTNGQATIRITQTSAQTRQTTNLSLDVTQEGIYLLAIPTSTRSSSPAWRLTNATIDNDGRAQSIKNMFPSRSSRCAYLSIAIERTNVQNQSTNLRNARGE